LLEKERRRVRITEHLLSNKLLRFFRRRQTTMLAADSSARTFVNALMLV